MDIPILIITYNRFDFVLQILQKLNVQGFRNVYISVDDYPRDPTYFSRIENFLKNNNFKYNILKWDKNVGCENNVLDSTKWFFEQVERGVILEDDCMPSDAFFELLKKVDSQFANDNVSFFSNNTHNYESFFLRPSYIPFFWGWYSNRSFFEPFYSFAKAHRLTFSHVGKIIKSPFSLKAKLIILINYLTFRYGRGGTSWDSVLFFYQIINKEPFLVPSHSTIENVGFGCMDASFTHTERMPGWCRRIRENSNCINVSANIRPANFKENKEFLDEFYIDYPGGIKLLITFILTYFKTRKFKKNINNKINVEASLQ